MKRNAIKTGSQNDGSVAYRTLSTQERLLTPTTEVIIIIIIFIYTRLQTSGINVI